ncbi:MAG: hypothetical protein ABI053_04795 [Lacisediminihabitans sp.]
MTGVRVGTVVRVCTVVVVGVGTFVRVGTFVVVGVGTFVRVCTVVRSSIVPRSQLRRFVLWTRRIRYIGVCGSHIA